MSWRKVTAGVYVNDEGEWFLCAREACEFLGKPYTRENHDWVVGMLVATLQSFGSNPTVVKMKSGEEEA